MGWTEFAGLDIEGQAKKRGWTLQDWTLEDNVNNDVYIRRPIYILSL